MITKRDTELLRTICRLKLLRVQNVVGVLFSHVRSAQRRFAALRDLGLIRSHRKGLPICRGPNGPAYYSLTEQGLAWVLEAFPGESHLAGSAGKALARSLRHPEHHESLVALYMQLVCEDDTEELVERATRIRYWGDGDIRIAVHSPLIRADIYPDAVLENIEGGPRVFVELDRSSNSQKRITWGVEKYAAGFQHRSLEGPFEDERVAELVYITKSKQRAEGLRNRFRALPLAGLKVSVVPFPLAGNWLRATLLDHDILLEEPQIGHCCERIEGILARLYGESCGIANALKRSGQPLPALDAHSEAYEFLRAKGVSNERQ